MVNHLQKYLKFRGFLHTRQRDCDETVDIREKVLGLRHSDLTIGYVNRSLVKGNGANLRLLFPKAKAFDQDGWLDNDTFLITGTLFDDPEHSHLGTMRMFEEDIPLDKALLFELGFLTSTHSWSHAIRTGDKAMACLGFVYDDIAHYFMADYPNRLIRKLNSDAELSEQQRTRSKGLIDRLVKQRISKYNAQPMKAPAMTQGYKRRVLVCDQTYADASTVYGRIDDAGFEEMLLAAIRENPDAEILVKSHPDTSWEKEKRVGYYSQLRDEGRIRILRDPVNPFVLFDEVDTVYVGTSQMGLEALFAGKKVVCFGAPFYAGWGLTDDRQEMPHRHRERTLEDLFYFFYIWYTIYHVPGKEAPSQIEDVLDFIEANRPVALPPSKAELDAPVKVSVVLPVYGVENWIEECLTSIQRQTLREIEIIPVNDQSPDGSQKIIDRMAAEDPRIRPIILHENAGQGFARNAGIDAARGDYIWFLDSDDIMAASDHLETVYNMAVRNGSDMVRGRKLIERVEHQDGRLKVRRRDETEQFFEKEIQKTTFVDHPEILHNRHFWTWLYRRDFLNENNIRFKNGQWEERPFLLDAWLSSKTISLSRSECAIYRVRPTSTARREKTDKDIDWQLRNFIEVMSLLWESGAFKTDSPLRQHAMFTVSQYMHHLFFGFAYTMIASGSASMSFKTYCETIATELDRLGVRHSDLVASPLNLSVEHVSAGAYPLILSALLSRRFGFVRRAIKLQPIEQKEVYSFWREAPGNPVEADFRAALNTYARNDRIRTSRVSGPVPKRPRIIIHIGASKTGSTYLQHLMEANRPELLRHGVWYPEKGLFWQENRPHKQAGHAHVTRFAIRQNAELKRFIEAGLKLHEGKIHTIVFSSEAFFLNQRSPEIANYFSDFNVEVVLYVRRQDEWANSQYAEFVSGGAVGRVDVTIAEWLARDEVRRLMDYRTTLDRWAALVGKDAISVRVYDRAEFPNGDLVEDFAATVGLPELLELERPESRLANDVQLSTPHVHALRMFNTMKYRSRDDYFSFIQTVTDQISAWRAANGLSMPKPNMLTTQQRKEILEAAEASNAEIKNTYFSKRKEPLFVTDIPKQTEDAGALHVEELEIIWAAYRRYEDQTRQLPAGQKAAAAQKVLSLSPELRKQLPRTAYPVKSTRFLLGAVYLQFSRYFDGKWYKREYPDVAAAGVNPVLHYLAAGCAEGRNPSEGFDTKRYYAYNPDVLEAGQNALVHYLRFGRKESRKLGPKKT